MQGAINAALAAPGSDEIRISRGTFVENLVISPNGSGNLIEMTAGWDASFTAAGSEPSVIDGNGTGRVFDIDLDDGDGLTLYNLRIQNGHSDLGAGLLSTQNGDSVLSISHCEVVGNAAVADRSDAAGLRVWVYENSQFTLFDSLIADNQAICSGTVDCREGGMGLQAGDSAQVTVSRNHFTRNGVVIEEGDALTGGARIDIDDAATGLIEDNLFEGNSIAGTSSGNVGIGLYLPGDGAKIARRNRIKGNTAMVPFPQNVPQMSVSQGGGQTTIVSDTVIAGSATRGLSVTAFGGGGPTVHVVNLTVSDHAGIGVRFVDNNSLGNLTLSNSIAVNNGENVNLAETIVTTNNRTSGPAGFVDAPGGDYSLLSTSPAVDAGDNSPPGGLGPTDIDGKPRINAGTVDLGAHEYQSDVRFSDGFELP